MANCAELKWFKGDLNKAIETAKKEDKIIMIDYFAVWCIPCKNFDKEVWQNEEAIKKISKMDIIPMKLDAEKEGVESAKKYSITAYPTILFIDKNGNEIGRKVGYGGMKDVLNAIERNSADRISISELEEKLKNNPEDLSVAYKLAKKLSTNKIKETENLYQNIYEKDKNNEKGYGTKAFVERLMLKFQDLSNSLNLIERLAALSYREIEPVTLVEGEKEINFNDAQKSAIFLYKGIVREKKLK